MADLDPKALEAATDEIAVYVKKEARAEMARAVVTAYLSALVPTPQVEPVADGEANYQAYRRAHEAEDADEPADLPSTLRMLELWGPEALPANENGQVHFARSLLDSAASAIRKHLATPPPVEAAQEPVAWEAARPELYDENAMMADGEVTMTAAENVLAWLLIEVIGLPDDVGYSPKQAGDTIAARLRAAPATGWRTMESAPKDGTAADAVERAYGILWRNTGRDSPAMVIAARKELLTAIPKDGQKRGIEYAISIYGPSTEADAYSIEGGTAKCPQCDFGLGGHEPRCSLATPAKGEA